MHCSMQAFDTGQQKQMDVNKIFSRAKNREVAWITGTEAGPASMNLRKYLRDAGDEYGYRLQIAGDIWIAVRKAMIRGDWMDGWINVLESEQGAGKHSDRGVCWVQFVSAHQGQLLGQVSVAAAHYLTKGRQPGDPNYRLNSRLSVAIGNWGKVHGKGAALAFYGGDQNIVDSKDDTFRGAPFTSLGDELKKYPSTGHGPIDVIASYNADKRVTGKYWRTLSDQEFRLNTDHFLCEGGYSVTALRTAKKTPKKA